jgi:hypothetical protein
MESTKNFWVDLPEIFDEFKSHTEVLNNKRIFFSAKFGSGKSTFLTDFFDQHKDEYTVFKLYPVNYAVATNEDVFELIKYDLFSELFLRFADKLDIQPLDFSPLLVAQSYALHKFNINNFLKIIIKATLQNGEVFNEIVEAAKKAYDDFKSYQETMNHTDKDVIEEYTQWFDSKKGSIYERDEITLLLTDLISRVKEKNESKPAILIIDDLDRLDPEHVFRLFNVFSAHYDASTDLNKFGFDQVIFVCDYNNIKLMYHHKYGQGVDFDGYINKFYSDSIFHFDPFKQLKDSINELLRNVPVKGSQRALMIYDLTDKENNLYRGLRYFLAEFVSQKTIAFRELLNLKTIRIDESKIDIGGHLFSSANFYFITLIKLLKQIMSVELIIDGLSHLEKKWPTFSLKEINTGGRYLHWLLNDSFYYLLSEAELSGLSGSEKIITKSVTLQKSYEITYQFDHDRQLLAGSLTPFEQVNVFGLLKQSLEATIVLGLL